MARHQFLDSLRGVAILGVVMTHVGQSVNDAPAMLTDFFRFGLRGVQLFFMVSALTLSLVTKPATLDLPSFYVRRFFRIAPMFYLAAMFYLLSPSLLGVDFVAPPVTGFDMAFAFLFVHGFDPHGMNSVVPGGWSIASEVMFYAIFPLLLYHAASLRRASLLLCVSLGVAVINGALPIILKIHDPMWKDFFHFNFLTSLPAFLIGLVLFTWFRENGIARPAGAGRHVLPGVVVASAVLVGCLGDRIPATQLLMLFPLGGLVFVAARYEPRWLVNPVLGFIGEISFSIYLVHFAVLHALGDMQALALPGWQRLLLLYGATIAASSLVAWVCRVVVEQPMVRVGYRVSTWLQRPPAAMRSGLGAEPVAETDLRGDHV
ncbi:acyltransferase [Novosphingobium resinovorum]|uniref:acyltransferase family protein n=1 Tax=Novosphingobium resinovorum TaxID=158500 RepID=UPI002ED5A157|nr:acyltransferase [Novosphingobium resinovorum]